MDSSGNQSIKRRSELRLTTSNRCGEAEAAPDNKRRKKTKEESGLCSLPDAVVLSCLAQVSRRDHAAFSLVSKTYRSLITSPELLRTRWLIGCTEASYYVCLRIFPEPSPRWFILTRYRRLSPIPSNPDQAPDLSSFVVVDSGIYVVGGMRNGKPCSDVWFLECLSHTWRRAPSMKMARASASASLVDGKIYVFGGLGDDDDDNDYWAEVFDPNTETWALLVLDCGKIGIIHQSVLIEGKRFYGVDMNKQSFTISLLPTLSTSLGKLDMRGYRKDWCVIRKLLFSCSHFGVIVWCEPDKLIWKKVKGLNELKSHLYDSRHIIRNIDEGAATKVGFINEITKLSTNSSGNIVIFWIKQIADSESLELCSAEISLEVRLDGREVWGKVIRSGPIFELNTLSHSYGAKAKVALEAGFRRGNARERLGNGKVNKRKEQAKMLLIT